MKRLLPALALLGLMNQALAYQPHGYPAPPYPHQVPPAFLLPQQVYAPPAMAVRLPEGAYRAPVRMPWSGTRGTPLEPGRALPSAAQADRPGPAHSEEKAATVPAPKPAKIGAHQREFLAMLLPIVERENARLSALRTEVQLLLDRLARGQASKSERQQLLELARRYRVQGKVLGDAQAREDLLSRIDTIPPALALAQAANESAWGRSRFAREGNNLFGIWTYDQSKGIVPRQRPEGAKYLVRKFDDYGASVRYYLHTLNSHPAYGALREARARARDQGDRPKALDLAAGLVKYSAKGELYVELIRELINRYQLAALVVDNPSAG